MLLRLSGAQGRNQPTLGTATPCQLAACNYQRSAAAASHTTQLSSGQGRANLISPLVRKKPLSWPWVECHLWSEQDFSSQWVGSAHIVGGGFTCKAGLSPEVQEGLAAAMAGPPPVDISASLNSAPCTGSQFHPISCIDLGPALFLNLTLYFVSSKILSYFEQSRFHGFTSK